jgi:hypothetical protein
MSESKTRRYSKAKNAVGVIIRSGLSQAQLQEIESLEESINVMKRIRCCATEGKNSL